MGVPMIVPMIVNYPLGDRPLLWSMVQKVAKLKAINLCRKASTWEQIRDMVFHNDNDERVHLLNKVALCIDPEKGLYIYCHDSKYYILRYVREEN